MTTGTKTESTLKELVSELDCELGDIGCGIEILTSIKSELSYLSQDVDTVDFMDGVGLGIKMREIYPKIKILDALVRYLIDDLNQNYDDAYRLYSEIYKITTKRGNKKAQG